MVTQKPKKNDEHFHNQSNACFNCLYKADVIDRKKKMTDPSVYEFHTHNKNEIKCYLFCPEYHFQALSQNCEKRLLVSSCLSLRPSLRPRGTNRLPLDRLSLNLILEYLIKMYRVIPNFVNI